MDATTEQANKALKDGNLALAQEIFEKLLSRLEQTLVPPYADYYRIQQSLWRVAWMRHGNKKFASKKVPRPAMDSVLALDSLD